MNDFINRYKRILLIISLFIFIAFIVFVFLSSKPQTSQPTKEQQGWNGLVPGVSTKEDVSSKLGKPINESIQGSQSIDEYSSTSPTRNHTATYNKDTAVFFKEIVSINDKKTVSDLVKLYGNPEATLYGPDSVGGYNLYAYPTKGVAYLGNPTANTLLEIWYYPPTDLNFFLKNWAKGYSTNTPPPSF